MPDVKGGLVTPISSAMTRIVSGVRDSIRSVGTGNWFGPLQPLKPMAPEDVKGRQWNYPVGLNLNYVPRGESGTSGSSGVVSFAELRQFADNLPILRLVIETRKDQIESINWVVKPKGVQGRKFSDAGKLKDPRVQQVTQFLASPDQRSGFATWMRQLLEEVFVTDALTIYPRLKRGGGLYSLDLIDGATIKPLIDSTGRPPAPPDPAYQQILHGIPAADFSRDELLYLPRNRRVNRLYGYSQVEQIILTVNIALRREVFTLNYYKEGTLPEAFGTLPKEWTQEQIGSFQAYFDALLTDNLADRRKLRFMPSDFKFQEVRQPPLKDAYDEWLARIVCYAFSVPATPFVSQVNRATADSLRVEAAHEGLTPLKNWIKAVLDLTIQKYMGFDDLEFAWDDSDTTDPLQRSQADQIDIASRVKTVNEVRDERGLPPLLDDQADGAPPPSPLDIANAKGGAFGEDKKPGGEDAEKPGVKVTKHPFEKLAKYSPNQTRDGHGRFASSGAASLVEGRRRKPKEVAGAKWDATTPEGVRHEAGIKAAKGVAKLAGAAYAAKYVPALRQAIKRGAFTALLGATGSRRIAFTSSKPAAVAAGVAASLIVGGTAAAGIHDIFSSGHALLEQTCDALGIHRSYADKAVTLVRTVFYSTLKEVAPDLHNLAVGLGKAADDQKALLQLFEVWREHGDALATAWVGTFKRAIDESDLDDDLKSFSDTFADGTREIFLKALAQAEHEVETGEHEKLAKAAETWPEGKAPKPKHLRNLRALWKDILAKAAKETAKAYRASAAEKLAKGVDTVDVDFSDSEDEVAEALAEAASDGGGAGLNELFDKFGEPASGSIRTAVFDAAQERAHAWAAQHAAELVSQVSDTTRTMLRGVIANGLSDGLTTPEIADEIESAAVFSDERAATIAQTEVTNANSAGALEGYRAAQDNGLKVKKAWLNGSNPCPVCEENAAAGFIALEEEFPSGDVAPAAHPHCQCALTAKAVEDDEE